MWEAQMELNRTNPCAVNLQVFAELGDTHWTLLVNEVNRHVPEVKLNLCLVELAR